MDDKNNKNVPQPTVTPPAATDQPAQPTPQPQPAQPVPAVPPMPQMQQPAAPQMPGAAPVPPKKGLSKGALWGIIGGSVGLIVVVVGIVLAVIFLGGPSKADYQEALKTLEEFTNHKITAPLQSSNSDNIKKRVEESISRADTMMKKLESSKIMRDGETKKSFGEYKAAYDKVRPNMEKIASVVEKLQSYSKKCSLNNFNYFGKPADEVKKLYDEKMSDCYQLLDNVAKSEEKELQEFAKKMTEYYKAFGDYLVARANKDYSARAPKLASGISPLSTFTKNIKDSNITKHQEAFVELVKKKAEN